MNPFFPLLILFSLSVNSQALTFPWFEKTPPPAEEPAISQLTEAIPSPTPPSEPQVSLTPSAEELQNQPQSPESTAVFLTPNPETTPEGQQAEATPTDSEPLESQPTQEVESSTPEQAEKSTPSHVEQDQKLLEELSQQVPQDVPVEQAVVSPTPSEATSAQTQTPSDSEEEGPPIAHLVLVWLETPGQKEAIEKIAQATRDFVGVIPGLESVVIGTPLPSTRKEVDSSYDVALLMRFSSKKALAEYENHPVHLEVARKQLAPLIFRIQVYDFVIQ